jgi:BirA family biotin operon repressor/biotin-[acetyl-CoA-carboxylase] ligase
VTIGLNSFINFFIGKLLTRTRFTGSKMAVFNIHHFDSLDSTNTAARKFPAGSVIVAKEQTAGRGSFKREWSSAAGGVCMSIVVLGDSIKNLKYLTIMAAVAVQHALEKVCGVVASIKWPNDLILEERKLCGILTEGYFEGDEAKMILGIGVNTNNMVPDELRDVAVSLHDLGISVDNERFVKGIVDEFSALLAYHVSILRGINPDRPRHLAKSVTVE